MLNWTCYDRTLYTPTHTKQINTPKHMFTIPHTLTHTHTHTHTHKNKHTERERQRQRERERERERERGGNIDVNTHLSLLWHRKATYMTTLPSLSLTHTHTHTHTHTPHRF